MAAIPIRGQAMRRPTNKYMIAKMGVYTFPDTPRKKERTPNRQPLDFAVRYWDRVPWPESPVIAIAVTLLFAALFVASWLERGL
jgi:hypothetical protein